jgi:hypothetical protein
LGFSLPSLCPPNVQCTTPDEIGRSVSSLPFPITLDLTSAYTARNFFSCPLVISSNPIPDSRKKHVSSLSNLPHSAIRTAPHRPSSPPRGSPIPGHAQPPCPLQTEPLFTTLSESRDNPHCAIHARHTEARVLVVRGGVAVGHGAQEKN